ncbi:MAG: hypothetical protein ABJB74_12395 [Gemmatimonas sp.]
MTESNGDFAPPSLCLRVGVTANRWREDGEDPDVRIDPANRETLEQSVRQVLTMVSRAVNAAHNRGQREHYYAATPPVIRLISPLAEGGDRIVGSIATTLPQWELYVVSPEDISQKPDRDPHIPLKPLWDSAKGRLTLGGAQLDEDSLIEVNRRLLWNCDLLVAIWDKRGARGEAGTGNVIQLASELGLPVINIDAAPTPAGPKRSSATPHPYRVLEPNGTRSRDNDDKAIDAVVAHLLRDPPDVAIEAKTHGKPPDSARTLFETFRTERVSSAVVRRASGWAWGAFMRVLTFSRQGHVQLPSSSIKASVDEGYPPPWEGASPPRPYTPGVLEAVVSPSFRRSDYFATAYAMRHRGSAVWLVLLAPFAVMFAWCGTPPVKAEPHNVEVVPRVENGAPPASEIATPATGIATPTATTAVPTVKIATPTVKIATPATEAIQHTPSGVMQAADSAPESTKHESKWTRSTMMVILELSVLLAIMYVYVRALRKKFHERWLDYRLLAERLRHLGFLWFVARGSLAQRVPVPDAPEDPHTAWVNWLYRATARQVPLPSVQFTTPYLVWYKEFLRERVVIDQRAYLEGTFHAAEKAEHRLRFWAWIPFAAAFFAASIHGVGIATGVHVGGFWNGLLEFVAIVGPGFGAALHAFGSNLGLPEQALRSRSTIRALSVVLESLDKVHIDQIRGSTNLQAAIALGELAQQTASALGDDLVGWRVDYLVRPTPQPG